MTDSKWTELRKPFPKESIGTIPKGGVQLDYVGHAAVTDRLLTVDPEWTWEPIGVDQNGSPALDSEGNLWIKLTVLGVTRLGVGDGKTMKERIGDALRNAAMRFGVALDLWSKDELESTLDHPELKNEKPSLGTRDFPVRKPVLTGMATEKQRETIKSMLERLGISLEEQAGYLVEQYGVEIPLSKEGASFVIDELMGVKT